MTQRNPYDLFARVYDAWQAGFTKPFSEAILPFYEREILRHGVPDRSLADIACGTGTFLRTWARRQPGWRLVGTDGSLAMIREARTKGVSARLIHATIEETRLPFPVGAAVSVFDSVNHVTRVADLRRGFRAIARSLLPGGLFLFDLNDDRAFTRLFSGHWTVESEGLFVSVTATSEGAFGASRFTIFSRERGGKNGRRAGFWRRSEITIRERNWHRDEILAAIRGASFVLLSIRKLRPYPADEVDSPRTLWVCRRPHRASGMVSSTSVTSSIPITRRP